MKTWKRWTLWTVGLLLGLPLLLGLAWLALNSVDADPQPWPETLALPGNTLAAEDNPLLALPSAHSAKGTLSLGDCKAEDCWTTWRAKLPQLAELRAANPAFGAACEAAAAREGLRFEEPMPERMTMGGVQAEVIGALRCHTWLLIRALEAVVAGDATQTQHWLTQADRVDRAVLGGARSLIAQMVSVALWRSKLQVLHGVAQQQPAWATALAPLAQLDGRPLLASQQAWVRVEANYSRAAVDSLRADACQVPREVSWFERWSCPWVAPAAQPEYMTQLFAARWARVLQVLAQADNLPIALPALSDALLDAPRGWWTQVRHTVPLWMDAVARPVMPGYFERAADLQLAAEATHLWLQDSRAPLPERASPALRKRLVAVGGGEGKSGWQLTPFYPDGTSQPPLRWTPPT